MLWVVAYALKRQVRLYLCDRIIFCRKLPSSDWIFLLNLLLQISVIPNTNNVLQICCNISLTNDKSPSLLRIGSAEHRNFGNIARCAPLRWIGNQCLIVICWPKGKGLTLNYIFDGCSWRLANACQITLLFIFCAIQCRGQSVPRCCAVGIRLPRCWIATVTDLATL